MPEGRYRAFQFQLRIVSRGITWKAMHIIILNKDDPNDKDEPKHKDLAGERSEDG
jgi:hypothetical protein